MILKKIEKIGKYRDYAPIFIRFIFLMYVIKTIIDGKYNWTTVQGWIVYLDGLNFPLPTVFAILAVYVVFLCQILIVIGYKVRMAAIPIIIYFIVAIGTVHIPKGDDISKTMPALVLLMMGFFLLFNGAGKPSIDETYS